VDLVEGWWILGWLVEVCFHIHAYGVLLQDNVVDVFGEGIRDWE
jgi:hypothetical protein